MNEPDYEAIVEAREERRGEAYLERMDHRFGRVEEHRTGPERRCLCGRRWGGGQVAHDCHLLKPAGWRP